MQTKLRKQRPINTPRTRISLGSLELMKKMKKIHLFQDYQETHLWVMVIVKISWLWNMGFEGN
ncbi:hypothetical protein HanHA300_Chr15g0562251 [Helianthus annuus]|nr:hypothetical protein HanHA300_Chr15g0562251 [Helianthus annuus]KAJ0472828.1 hypothetical protein HanHA89_Chr15g0611451 [Helianthus annuus]KAJ0648436.1 hypothetical protein HanLR1_Chr15g0572871 [Helianthus annuus]KAJ0652265.1 hypothetical protein HanOQP8_Chr15g0570211 [Helianthus annuus]